MTSPKSFTVLALVAASFLAIGCEEPTPGGANAPAKTAASYEGGTPLPTGAMTIIFPWMGKQSIMCVGEKSVERQVAFIDFGTDQNDAQKDPKQQMLFGSVTLDEKGNGTGAFIANAKQLRSGHAGRDTKLLEGAWLDEPSHPTLGFTATKMTKVKPTVWQVEGTWNMRGVSKQVTFFANVRYVGEMKYVGKTVARMKGSFNINLKEYGITNPSVGTQACSAEWTIDVVLLGSIQKK